MNSQFTTVNSHLESRCEFNISFNLTHVTAQLGLIVWGRAIRRWKAGSEAQTMVTVRSKSQFTFDSTNLPASATYGFLAQMVGYGMEKLHPAL